MNKRFIKVLVCVAVVLVATLTTTMTQAATYGNTFTKKQVTKVADYKTSNVTKKPNKTYGGVEITYMSYSGKTYECWIENKAGKNISDKLAFSNLMAASKIPYKSQYQVTETKCHLNISTSLTTLKSLTVSGSWTPNLK